MWYLPTIVSILRVLCSGPADLLIRGEHVFSESTLE